MAPRFVTGQRKQVPRENGPPATPRRPPDAAARPAAASQTTPGLSANQFARTPQFTFGRTPQSARGSRPPSPLKPRPGHALRTANRAAEDVEDPHDNEDDEMLDEEQSYAVPTTEVHDDSAGNASRDLPFSPKRRRVDDLRDAGQTARMSHVRPRFQHPATPASSLAAPPYFARPQSVASSTNGDGVAIRRPAFLRSSVAPSEQEPVPEAFSPHRRGEKFVPGGMAASLQQWVIEAGQAAIQGRRGYGYMRGEEYVLTFTVVSASMAGSPLLVRGKQADGTMITLLLVVSNGKAGKSLSTGSAVGVRAPIWQTSLDDVECTVGVDWRLL